MDASRTVRALVPVDLFKQQTPVLERSVTGVSYSIFESFSEKLAQRLKQRLVNIFPGLR